MIAEDHQENYGLGWVKIFRSIRNHWIWEDPVKFQRWIDILLEANHFGRKVNIGYEIFECSRGQSLMSLSNWAKRWKTSKDNARNFLKLLEKDDMILMENLKKSTRITVCNYDSYQQVLHDNQTQSKRNPNATSPKQECKELKNEKKKDIYTQFFEVFKEESGKKIRVLDDKSKRQLNARLKEGYTMEDIKSAIINCKNDPYHMEHTKYLTPEFITRADKLVKYMDQGKEVKFNPLEEAWKQQTK